VQGEVTRRCKMYNNIGRKIKTLAKVICICIAVVWIIIGFSLILNRYSSPFVRLMGLLIILIGPLFAWVNSFLLYGYGELIEQNKEMLNEIKCLTKDSRESEKTNQKEAEEARNQEIERKLFEKAIKGEEKEEESEDASFYNPMREE
jgi:hypothetical protein